MAVDYDVVIIGGTLAGRYAAMSASQLGATVALVEMAEGQKSRGLEGTISFSSAPHTPPCSLASYLLPHALSEVGRTSQNVRDASQFHIHEVQAGSTAQRRSTLNLIDKGVAQTYKTPVQWAEAKQWANLLVSNLEDQYSPAVLAAQGVDFIAGSGQFEKKSQLTFTVDGRGLRSRAFLIAIDSRPAVPDVEGLQDTGYVTATSVWQALEQPNPPQRWVIVGSDPVGIQMAQTLNRLGLDVTLIARRSHILAQEDPEIAQLIQASLEAEGVRILTASPVTQMKKIDNKKWVQAGDEAIETDEILLAAGQQPNIENLNLEAVGVKWERRRLLLNEKLQTTNPRIYACGDAIGGYQFTNIANYEAKIALKNALFFPVFKVNYHNIPRVIFSEPQLARVGLTEAQARQKYGKDVMLLRQHFKSIAAAQLTEETTGMCKLIVRRNGEILGAAIVGSHAGEIINVIASAIAHKLKVSAIADLSPVIPSMSEIFEPIAFEYRGAKIKNSTLLQNLLEEFFNFRRSWQ